MMPNAAAVTGVPLYIAVVERIRPDLEHDRMVRWARHVAPALAKVRQGTEDLAHALEQGLAEAAQWMQAEAEREKDEDVRQGLRAMVDARRTAVGGPASAPRHPP